MINFDKIRSWAKEKKILNKGNIKTQYIKLQEESGELAEAIKEATRRGVDFGTA